MARIGSIPRLSTEITIILSEEEAAALDALVGYGDDSFLKVFYKEMGEAYLKPHENGLRSLFRSVRTGDGSVSNFLFRTRQARKVLQGEPI